MNKPRFVISCPFDTYSGYGARSRDIIKAIIEIDKYDVELLSQRWGETSWGFCKENPEWSFLVDHLAKTDWNKTQPDLWMQITIPSEFQAVGKYNIGCTAGIESTACKGEWVEGLNRMDTNWVSSNHAKTVFESAGFDQVDKRTKQNIGTLKCTKPIEVIFEGVNLDVYKHLKPSELKTFDLSSIEESFCYLFVGHWMNGNHGHDRKNVGVLIKEFFETYKNKKGLKPALLLKCSVGTSSYVSREEILDRINGIKKSINTKDLPNVYLLNGEFSDLEMNELYNNPKVKGMVTTTKGEGFGRPLLEFSAVGKPIIASGWSGQTDFLNPQYVTLLPGNLENVHKSAANNWLIEDSKWFQVSATHLKQSFKDVYKKYKQYSVKGKQQKQYVKTNFSWDKMKELIEDKLSIVPEFAKQNVLKLPELNLPKLTKLK
jgi:glycosyltransferase involved in cell wall biosynthesis